MQPLPASETSTPEVAKPPRDAAASASDGDAALSKLTQPAANDGPPRPKPARSASANKTLLGLPVTHLLKDMPAARSKKTSARPGGSLPALAPGAMSVPAAAKVQEHPPRDAAVSASGRSVALDATQDVSLQDVSLAELHRGRAPDFTQDLSLSDVAVEGSDPSPHAAATESAAEVPESFDAELLELAAAARKPKLGLWVWAALPVVLGGAWFAFASFDKAPEPSAKAEPIEREVVAAAAAQAAPAEAPKETDPKASAPSQAEAQASTKVAQPGEAETPTEAESAEVPEAKPSDENDESEAAGESEGAGESEAADEGEAADESEAVEASDAAKKSQAVDPKLARAAKKAELLVKQADALRKRRKYAPASARYRSALKVYPDYPEALAGLTHLAIARHAGSEAVKLAQTLVEKAPDEMSYRVLLGDAYKSAGKKKDARDAWKVAARKGNKAARARLKR